MSKRQSTERFRSSARHRRELRCSISMTPFLLPGVKWGRQLSYDCQSQPSGHCSANPRRAPDAVFRCIERRATIRRGEPTPARNLNPQVRHRKPRVVSCVPPRALSAATRGILKRHIPALPCFLPPTPPPSPHRHRLFSPHHRRFPRLLRVRLRRSRHHVPVRRPFLSRLRPPPPSPPPATSFTITAFR